VTVFYISPYITNVIFIVTVYLSGFQHVQLRRPNPFTNIQFIMMAFCLVMVLVVAFYNRVSPWLSLAFFLIAVGCLAYMYRQLRMLPPMRSFE
jgi:Ca2+/Na+ antiporter